MNLGEVINVGWGGHKFWEKTKVRMGGGRK